MVRECDELRDFLRTRVYHHPRINRIMASAQSVVRDLFCRYMAEPDQLPPEWRREMADMSRESRARHTCDFVAGMTDRFALSEHRRLFDVTPELR